MTKKAPDEANPKTALGLLKPAFHSIPPSALIHLGAAMENGRLKYTLMNWRGKKVPASVYMNAKLRHTWSWWDGEDIAADSLVHHLGHSMACDAIVLDAMETGNLIDDRPIKGTFAEIIARLTKKSE